MKKANKTLQKEFIRPLLKWYRQHARTLPWRETSDPYSIWVSEIMLQQTQVATVIPYWERWMKTLPTISALADASADQIHKLWEGLGYYRRVRLMQKAAIFIQENHHGTFPEDFEAILALPGIGPYTAGAISSIAFDKPSPILDGNVMRVLTRVYGIQKNPKESTCQKGLWELSRSWVQQAHLLIPRKRHDCSHLNQALMELGATVCLPNQSAKCDQCPIRKKCKAYELKIVSALPNLPQRRSNVFVHRLVLVIKSQGKFMIQKPKANEHNSGMCEFFNFQVQKTKKGKLTPEMVQEELSQRGMEYQGLSHLLTLKHTITHHRITLHCFTITQCLDSKTNPEDTLWCTKRQIEMAAMPSAHQKIRRAVLDKL